MVIALILREEVICIVIIAFFMIYSREKSVVTALVPMDLIMVCAIFLQIIIPQLLFTGACVTIVTVGVYFSIDNPAEKFRQRAYIDLNTGIKNKNCFQEDIRRLDEKYFGKRSPSHRSVIGVIVCDLNGLKSINDVHGHIAGDELIRSAAEVISDCMKTATNVYRIGGDEFVALYVDTSEEKMQSEISAMKAECDKRSPELKYPLSIAAGCAGSDPETASMNELIKTADKRMYTNKVIAPPIN